MSQRRWIRNRTSNVGADFIPNGDKSAIDGACQRTHPCGGCESDKDDEQHVFNHPLAFFIAVQSRELTSE